MSPPVVRFTSPTDSDATQALEGVQQALLQHPIAAQAAFSWLAAEGRRFAQTPEGAAWKERLASSELLPQLRLVWDSLGMTAFHEGTSEILPTFFVEGIVSAASAENIEALLTQVLARRM